MTYWSLTEWGSLVILNIKKKSVYIYKICLMIA